MHSNLRYCVTYDMTSNNSFNKLLENVSILNKIYSLYNQNIFSPEAKTQGFLKNLLIRFIVDKYKTVGLKLGTLTPNNTSVYTNTRIL